MKLSDAFPSKFLKADDLNDQDWTVTISKVTTDLIGQGENAQQKLIVHFTEMDKGFVLNVTNAKTIAKLYGDDTDDWIGNRITIWPNHDVEFKGEIVSAIRVRSRKPGAGSVRLVPSNNILNFEAALRIAAEAGIDGDELKARLRELGISSYNAKQHTVVVREIVQQHGEKTPDREDDPVPF